MTHKRSPRTWNEVMQRVANEVGGRCQLNMLVRTSGRKVWLECYFPRVAEWRALSPRLSHPQLAHWLDGFEKGLDFEEKNIHALGRFLRTSKGDV